MTPTANQIDKTTWNATPSSSAPARALKSSGWARTFSRLRAPPRCFTAANDALGFSLDRPLLRGPEERLNQTDISQPALYTAGVASFRAAVRSGRDRSCCRHRLRGTEPRRIHGPSSGRRVQFRGGLKLVAARGRYMQEAAVATPSGMVAILGADENAVIALCEQAAAGRSARAGQSQCARARSWSADHRGACQRVLRPRRPAGFKATVVESGRGVSQPADAAGGRSHASGTGQGRALRSRRVPVYSNVTAELHEDMDSIKRRLVEQIVSPVQWERTMKTLHRRRRACAVYRTCPGPHAGGPGQADQSPAAR